MTAVAHNIAIDCRDAYTLGQFWSAVTGYPLADDDFPGDPEASIAIPGQTTLLFIGVDEPKQGKNRLHLDLWPTDRTRDAEVDRLLELGATKLADHRRPDGTGWVTMADPDGNEFCVVRSQAERET